jgi:ElaB/YqjD/DUF883 family membrane-anchored ribosome-binding protein
MDQHGFSSDGATEQTTSGTTSGTTGTTGTTGGGVSEQGISGDSNSGGLSDRARSLADSAQEKLADVGSSVRDRAGHMKDSLADALDSGADKLRQRATGTGQSTLAGAGSSGSIAVETDGRMAQVNNRVAGGMSATADWLREADLDNLKSGIERQVKEHPGRSLLIAAGVGYLIGKALRK